MDKKSKYYCVSLNSKQKISEVFDDFHHAEVRLMELQKKNPFDMWVIMGEIDHTQYILNIRNQLKKVILKNPSDYIIVR